MDFLPHDFNLEQGCHKQEDSLREELMMGDVQCMLENKLTATISKNILSEHKF